MHTARIGEMLAWIIIARPKRSATHAGEISRPVLSSLCRIGMKWMDHLHCTVWKAKP